MALISTTAAHRASLLPSCSKVEICVLSLWTMTSPSELRFFWVENPISAEKAPLVETVEAKHGTTWGNCATGVEVSRCVTDRNGYHAGTRFSGVIDNDSMPCQWRLEQDEELPEQGREG